MKLNSSETQTTEYSSTVVKICCKHQLTLNTEAASNPALGSRHRDPVQTEDFASAPHLPPLPLPTQPPQKEKRNPNNYSSNRRQPQQPLPSPK